MSDKLLSVVSVAQSVGLSRQRFHQLMQEGVFPPPVYDIHTRRPHYTEEMLSICVAVRERNVGVNGRVVMFHARRPRSSATKKQIRSFRSKSSKRVPKESGLIEGLRGLGLTTITEQQIAVALKEAYPQGTDGVDQTTQLRTIFIHLMRRN
jgi:hypothetical protein